MKFAYVLSLAFVAYASHVDAYAKFMPLIPNSDTASGVDHTKGGKKLEFHEKFPGTWTQEFCNADSDGDGATNGEELGDPCCKWTGSGKPSGKYVSDPTDEDSKPSDLAVVKCAGGATSAPPSTAKPEAPSTVPLPKPTSGSPVVVPAKTPCPSSQTSQAPGNNTSPAPAKSTPAPSTPKTPLPTPAGTGRKEACT